MSAGGGAPGRILIDLFTTLDGVAQSPGSPQEDPSGGFRFGGWQVPISDEVVGREVLAGMAQLDALLLGRRTYDIWADYWPAHTDGPIGELFARVPKYIASHGTPELAWSGAVLIGDALCAEVAALRARHREVHVIGSLSLVQSLVTEGLFDVLNLWVYPVVLGEGKKVFPDGVAPTSLRLIEQPVVSGSGAVLLRYAPAGVPSVGDFDA